MMPGPALGGANGRAVEARDTALRLWDAKACGAAWYTDSGASNNITEDLDKLTMHDMYYGND
jgi:hypothetical protein